MLPILAVSRPGARSCVLMSKVSAGLSFGLNCMRGCVGHQVCLCRVHMGRLCTSFCKCRANRPQRNGRIAWNRPTHAECCYEFTVVVFRRKDTPFGCTRRCKRIHNDQLCGVWIHFHWAGGSEYSFRVWLRDVLAHHREECGRLPDVRHRVHEIPARARVQLLFLLLSAQPAARLLAVGELSVRECRLRRDQPHGLHRSHVGAADNGSDDGLQHTDGLHRSDQMQRTRYLYPHLGLCRMPL